MLKKGFKGKASYEYLSIIYGIEKLNPMKHLAFLYVNKNISPTAF